MQIIIPTRGRTEQQLTLQSLPPELRKRTTLVCPKQEAARLSSRYEDIEIVMQPDADWKIAQKRGWIMREWFRWGYDKIIMLDDDLSFATRISADDWHLRPIKGDELIPEFQRIEDKLGPEFPHVGFGQRLGNHQLAGGWKSPARLLCTLGYYLPIVTKECRFDLVELHEDTCVNLQLLLKGYPNAVWTETIINWCNLPGGVSTYRTAEMSNAEARKLAALFPDYVRVVHRNYKASGSRLEVIVQWQKALAYGQRRLDLT